MSENGVERSQGIHVMHDGPRQAPPLLLIHGSGASGASWSPVVPALASHHHVIRVDLPGCGQSPPSPSYDVPAQASRVAAVLDDLGRGPVTVVGHSSGGYVATALAEQRPDLVRSVALISCGPHPGALLSQPLILRILLGPPFGPLIWPRRSDAMIRKGIGATAARPVDVPDDAVADLKRTSYRTFRTILRRNTEYIAERGVPDRLAALTVPVLAVFGTADPRWDPASVRDYEVVPNARIELLPGVGHLPMFEAPEAISELLLSWTSRERTVDTPPMVPDP
ncbi:alpha/beta fold hydrolase [Amycolatopsis sp. lyj-108]|uniref:alpha/beta fold hydrolase n=1 Tax=Amycolatopsis sp. lyj-108 TaxID=2789286 RepID=UPI00397D81A0